VNRIDKTNYYLDIAETVLERGTCLRRNYGAIIVSNDEIIATGYTGAPRGRKNCIDIGICYRTKMQIPSGERYELCRSVHAEANAIISAARKDMIGSTLYLVGKEKESGQLVKDANSCAMCQRMIINAGIDKVIVRRSEEDFEVINVVDWVFYDDTLPNGRYEKVE
jgi:dCMP deaminase